MSSVTAVAVLFTAILTVEHCYKADGSHSRTLDPNTSTFTRCGGDEDTATVHARLSARGAVLLLNDPAPSACTYNVDDTPRCYCP